MEVDFSQDVAVEKDLIRVEVRISLFFSSCGRKLGVHLKLQWGSQGPACVASGESSLHASCAGPLRIPLLSVQGPKSSSRVDAVISSADMDLVSMEFQQGC